MNMWVNIKNKKYINRMGKKVREELLPLLFKWVNNIINQLIFGFFKEIFIFQCWKGI